LASPALTSYLEDEAFDHHGEPTTWEWGAFEQLARPGCFIHERTTIDYVAEYICVGTQCQWLGSAAKQTIERGTMGKVGTSAFARKPLAAFALKLLDRHWMLVVVDTAPPVAVDYYDSLPFSPSLAFEAEKRLLLRKFILDQGSAVRYVLDGSHVRQQSNSCAVATLQHLARRVRRPNWRLYNRRLVADTLQTVLAREDDDVPV
jgi:hypothetical protein